MLPPNVFHHAMLPTWILGEFKVFNIGPKRRLDTTVHNPKRGKEVKVGEIW